MKNNYKILIIPEEKKERMYGKITKEATDSQMYQCSCAICDCACTPICLGTTSDIKIEDSKLEKALIS